MGDTFEHIIQDLQNDSSLTIAEKIEAMYAEQEQSWQMLRNHYKQFESVVSKDVDFDGFKIVVQHNKARARSTCADLSKKAIKNRQCFLCSENLPKEQKGLSILDKYLLLINPFPIVNRHITISDFNHTPQIALNRVVDILDIAGEIPEYTIFYNGPKCGASAPDHFHFQAVKKGAMPIDSELPDLLKNKSIPLFTSPDISIYAIKDYLRNCIVYESGWKEPIDYLFSLLSDDLKIDDETGEPMMNMIATYDNEKYRLIVFPRSKQKPDVFYKEGEDRIVVGPASAELGGIFVMPREEDFNKITKEDIEAIYKEVMINDNDFNHLINIFKDLELL